MSRGVLYPIFGCLCMHLLSHQISTREGTMADRTAGGVKYWTPEIAIYLCTYTFIASTKTAYARSVLADNDFLLKRVCGVKCSGDTHYRGNG